MSGIGAEPPGTPSRFDGLRLAHWIDGRPVIDEPARTIEPPARIRSIVSSPTPVASTEEVDDACDRAAVSLSRWLALPPAQRSHAVCSFADRLAERGPDLVAITGLEAELPPEQVAAHVDMTVAVIRSMAAEPRSTRGSWVPPGVAAFVRSGHRSRHIFLGAVARVLLNDGVVIIKSTPHTQLIAQLVVEIAHGSLLPPGVINLVHGDQETVDALLSNPIVASVFVDGLPDYLAQVTRLAQLCGKPAVRYTEDPWFSRSVAPPGDPPG